MQCRYVVGRKAGLPEAVGPQDAGLHLVCHRAVLELQFHTHSIFFYGIDCLAEWVLLRSLVVPVPVGLHPGLVYAKVFPVFVPGPHIVGNPVESLSGIVAVCTQRRGNLVPVLVAAVYIYVVRQVDFFRSDVESGQLKISGRNGSEHLPGAVYVPVEGLQAVLHGGKVEPVSPISCRGLLVGEVLEHYCVGNADDDSPFALRRPYP